MKSMRLYVQSILVALLVANLLVVNQAKAINVSVTHATFKGEPQNYIELYLYVIAESVHYKTVQPQQVAATVETIVIFRQNDTIKKFDKYRLQSPLITKDTMLQLVDFTDLKRYALPNGQYEMEVRVTDVNNPNNDAKYIYKKVIDINYDNKQVAISDFQLIDGYEAVKDSALLPYSKNGLMLATHPFQYYPARSKRVMFYIELYNTHLMSSRYYIRYFIRVSDDNNDNKGQMLQIRAKKLQNKPIQALILQLNITDVPSGNYELVFEVRDPNKQLLHEKTIAFQRNNPYLNADVSDYLSRQYKGSFIEKLDDEQILYALKAISPSLQGVEATMHTNIIKSKDQETKRKYLYNYWLTQDAQTPEVAFKKYMSLAKQVDDKYRSSMQRGFETDRGYTYLKYGAPNDIIQQNSDPTAPPYEIWMYYDLNNQQNVKFVFANPSLAVNDFQLIHSTLRGEVNNPNWLRDLYKNSPIKGGNYLDNPQVGDQMGRNADDLFGQ